MEIEVKNISQRFESQWIFKNLNLSFQSNKVYGLSGPNGSGKSTLMKIISGGLEPAKGEITWDRMIFKDINTSFFQKIGFAAPYIDIPYWLTLSEFIDFHFKLKPAVNNLTTTEILKVSGLENHKNKVIQTFSSGMKQRVKLLTTILSNYDTLLLDEPATNLDDKAKSWFKELLENNLNSRLVIIASNEKGDFELCREIYSVV